MFVAFAHEFSHAFYFLYCACIALILKVSSPFEGIWSSKKSNESGTQKRPSRLASLTTRNNKNIAVKKALPFFQTNSLRLFQFSYVSKSCVKSFGSKRAVCCMYGVVVLLSKPFFIVIVAVVCVVIAGV